MRYVLTMWALPMLVFWGWFLLSLNDMNFGYFMLTRDAHDLFFRLYGEILGIDPAAIPPMAAKACIFDSVTLFAILAFRRRKHIRRWWLRDSNRFERRYAAASGSMAHA